MFIYIIQVTLSASDAVRPNKEIKDRGIIVEKLLDLQALVNSMLLPPITAEVVETLHAKEVEYYWKLYLKIIKRPFYIFPTK